MAAWGVSQTARQATSLTCLNPKNGGKLRTERAGRKEPPVFADDALILLRLQEGSLGLSRLARRGDLSDRLYRAICSKTQTW